MTQPARTTTARIMRINCPLCSEELEVHVPGLAVSVTAEEWLESLPWEGQEYIHEQHTSGEVTRVETRRIA